ncbi:MAG: hypothetical protein ACOCZQ_01135 [Nanoarchaeota archaeon]
MHEDVKKDIIDVLKGSAQALRNGDSKTLRELSNHTLHNSSIFQDKDSVNIAVVVYALSKIVDKEKPDSSEVACMIEQARRHLETDDVKGYEDNLTKAMEHVAEFDKKMDLYVRHIINQAGIKKGSRIYEHGISLARAAELFNISQWELMKYLGQTSIPDKMGQGGAEFEERLEHTRKLFGLKNE